MLIKIIEKIKIKQKTNFLFIKMQEEKLTPDLSYRNQIIPMDDILNEIDENRIIFSHTVNYGNIQWNDENRSINWGNGLNINIRYSKDFNKKNFDDTDIIDYLLPIDASVFFYNYTDYTRDNEMSYLKRDWTFNKNDSNPYHKLPVFGFNPQFSPDKNNPDNFLTFGLEELFNRTYEISCNFDLYVNTLFIQNYDFLFDTILGNVPEELRGLLGYNIKVNPIPYIVIIQTILTNGKDFNTNNLTFDNVVYSQRLVDSFNQMLVNSEYLNVYGSNARTPEEKDAMMKLDNTDPNKEYGFKRLCFFNVQKEISFINNDRLTYANFIPSLVNRDSGVLRGIALDNRLKVLFKIFLVKNKLLNDIYKLFDYFLNDSENYDRDILNPTSNYCVINNMLNTDKNEILNIFNNALIIKNYTNVFNPKDLNTRAIEHSLMSVEFFPKTAFYSHFNVTPENDEEVDIESVNKQFVGSKFRFTKDNYIEGKSVIFNYLGIRITLNELRGLNPYDSTCRVYFSDVLISVNNEGVMISDIESDNYPYYVAHFIHSSKDFLKSDGTSKEKLSVIKLEFKPEMNILERYLPRMNDFSKALIKIFSTTFYIKTSYFKNQIIRFSKVNRDNYSMVASPKKDSRLYYSIDKKFRSHLIKIEDISSNNVIDIKKEVPEKYIDLELIDFKGKGRIDIENESEMLKDDEFNALFKNFDNDFIIQKENSINNLEPDSEQDLDFLFEEGNEEKEEKDKENKTLSDFKIPKNKSKNEKKVNKEDIEEF